MKVYVWLIYIELPKERSKDGKLQLSAFIPNNTKLVFTYSCKCHGEGIAYKKSPSSYTYENGNTPTGTAQGQTKAPGSDKAAYGPHRRIEIFGAMTGQLKEVCYRSNPRRGLQIHGGRSQSKLWNTKGCVRIFDKDIKIIADYIDNSCKPTGTIKIDEK